MLGSTARANCASSLIWLQGLFALDGLSYPWYSFENLVNLLLKVHVQQPVSLIQHQMLQQLQAEALQIDNALAYALCNAPNQPISISVSACGSSWGYQATHSSSNVCTVTVDHDAAEACISTSAAGCTHAEHVPTPICRPSHNWLSARARLPLK